MRLRVDGAGSGKEEVYKLADMMCRVVSQGGKRFIDWNPSDSGFGKNPGDLAGGSHPGRQGRVGLPAPGYLDHALRPLPGQHGEQRGGGEAEDAPGPTSRRRSRARRTSPSWPGTWSNRKPITRTGRCSPRWPRSAATSSTRRRSPFHGSRRRPRQDGKMMTARSILRGPPQDPGEDVLDTADEFTEHGQEDGQGQGPGGREEGPDRRSRPTRASRSTRRRAPSSPSRRTADSASRPRSDP